MTRRLAIALALILVACASVSKPPLVLTLSAQTLPVTRTLVWTGNAADTWTVTLDGTVIGSPSVMSQVFTVSTPGTVATPHVLTVTSNNVWGTAVSQPLSFVVVLPTVASNLKIQ